MPDSADGFVLPIPTTNFVALRELASLADNAWREHGALGCGASITDDVKPGETSSFSQVPIPLAPRPLGERWSRRSKSILRKSRKRQRVIKTRDARQL